VTRRKPTRFEGNLLRGLWCVVGGGALVAAWSAGLDFRDTEIGTIGGLAAIYVVGAFYGIAAGWEWAVLRRLLTLAAGLVVVAVALLLYS
jgi:hypothetical protein